MSKTYCASLNEGTFSVGLDKKFVRIEPHENAAKGALKISLNPFLIYTPERKYLFDSGIGEFGEGTGPETIRKNLEKHGLTEYDITDIVCSHLHYDHIGGLANRENGYWELTFPDAKVWVSKKGWDKAINKELYYDDEKTEFLHFLNARADLHFLDDEDQPYPELKTKTIGGHTEFHQVLLFNDGTHKFMQAGDVIATKVQINRKFEAKYDFDPVESKNQREILGKLAYDEGFTILCYHDTQHPIVKIKGYEADIGYILENIDSYDPT